MLHKFIFYDIGDYFLLCILCLLHSRDLIRNRRYNDSAKAMHLEMNASVKRDKRKHLNFGDVMTFNEHLNEC